MATGPRGERRTLEDARGDAVIVDLRRTCGPGFDAAGAVHLYEVTVTGRDATFAIDGRVVGRFGARDMGGLWRLGPMRGFASLWCAGPEIEGWAGRWNDDGQPLVGRLLAAGHTPLTARPSRLGALIRGLKGG
jgi:hypothetical protein